jgi:hypothetical protein
MNVLRRGASLRGRVAFGMACAALIVGLAATGIQAQEPAFIPLPASASVKIVEPVMGATVRSPVKVVFSVSGTTVKPAGPVEGGTGHHHLLINEGPTPEKVIVPADATHLHFGKGQTETTVELKPGSYTLTLQFADGLHRSYGPKGAHSIKITVSDY